MDLLTCAQIMLPKILIMMASAGPSVSLLAQATIQNNTP